MKSNGLVYVKSNGAVGTVYAIHYRLGLVWVQFSDHVEVYHKEQLATV